MLRILVFSALALSLLAFPAAGQSVTVQSDTGGEEILAAVRDELPEADAPESIFEARRQARRAAERVSAFLNSRGYFNAEISHAVEAGPPIRPMIKVEPGPQFEIGEVRVDLGKAEIAPEDRQALDARLSLKPGAAAQAQTVIAQEALLVSAMKSLGYPDARAKKRRVNGDREAETLDVVYRLTPGPKVRLGEVIFDDGQRTRKAYLKRLVPFEEGVLYSPDRLSDFNRRMGATRLYDIAAARLDEESARTGDDGTEIRDVHVTLKERDRYTFGTGASFSTNEGPGLTTTLVRRNATRRGDTVSVSAVAAAQERSLGADWRIPNAVAYDKGFVVGAEAKREETDAFDREAVTVSGAYEVRHSERLTYSLGAASEYTREDDVFTRRSAEEDGRELQIFSVSAAARLDNSDDPLDPTKGWRADARIEPALATGGSDVQFFTATGQVSGYQPLWKEDTLIAAGRVRTGFVYGADIADLPVSRRFFAGGGGSARGFGYQSVGPADPLTGDPTGGRGLLEGSAELRWRGKGNLGYVAFVDAATVTENQSPTFEDLRYSAGLGVRYDTAVGPIRFDVATPLDRQDGEDALQIYVSIGQAF